MALPREVGLLDVSGKYQLNKGLSDETDEILRLQGLPWIKRKAARVASVYLTVRHFKDANSVEHIETKQTLSGGVGGNTEHRILDWEQREVDDPLFGPLLARSRRAQLDDVDKDWLKQGWTDEVQDLGIVLTYVEGNPAKGGKKWAMEQTWGFEEIDGERRSTRHLDFLGPAGEKVRARLVYDYQGPL
ncbi:hypothetical protein CERSUDRAFT_90765 [Gelatoporia subvermispora B]|uniref:Uncharacterized protein n=1 Tax=Ceriporiopsis subvermispora (strain B) TaxID=914234 RepID=M2RT96_CERS8|nr:hypothetical protein CERSUDRAFT_90765 [Gelatoporia subvermispora B]